MAYPFKLPDLGYPFDALEPHVDARTMEIHHDKHHAGYTRKLNAALENHSQLQGYEAEQLLRDIDSIPSDIRTAVRNNGGGYVNHTLFWEIMKPGGSSEPVGSVARAIGDTFGSLDSLQERLTAAAKTQFGSGWGWLVVDGFGNLQVTSTPNQDSPVMDGKTPVLGVDVWEHAYYLKYQNRRPDYLEAWWNVVNWDAVNRRYEEARG